jgi:uncharacterized protein YpmS
MNEIKILMLFCFLLIVTSCNESEKEEIKTNHKDVKNNTKTSNMSEAERLLEELQRDSTNYKFTRGDSLTEEEKAAFE